MSEARAPQEPHPIVDSILPALAERDDAALWELAVSTVLADAEAQPDVRHLLITVARVPASKLEGAHPEESADLRLSWAKAREQVLWEFVGHTPRVRRRRGHYVLTVSLPQSSEKLGFVQARVAWRPRFPWADPTDTGVGRQDYTFSRDGEGKWRFRGARET